MAVSTVPRSPAATLRRDPASPWRHVDVVLLGAALAIAALGVLMVWSATRRTLVEAGLDPFLYLKRQASYVGLGAVLCAGVTLIDYRHLRDVALALYVGLVVLLLTVLTPLGSEARGIQAWFDLGLIQLQPAELGKVVLVVVLATFCTANRDRLEGPRLVTALALVAVPVALIYLQPDVGTIFVYVAITMGVLLVAGIRPRHIVLLTALGLLGVIGVFRMGMIEDYQRDRLAAFLDPEHDVQRAAYSLNQSQTAIGNGGLTGQGLLRGSQTNLNYVPEQSTDFIFTVVGEELGFVGASTLLSLFSIVVWRTWRVASLARDTFGSLVCAGVLVMLVFQVFQNIGMTMGIMPITGIPLPLVSYGGSSALATFLALGLVLNVHMRRFR